MVSFSKFTRLLLIFQFNFFNNAKYAFNFFHFILFTIDKLVAIKPFLLEEELFIQNLFLSKRGGGHSFKSHFNVVFYHESS